jgi:hypothetical protein
MGEKNEKDAKRIDEISKCGIIYKREDVRDAVEISRRALAENEKLRAENEQLKKERKEKQ